MRATAALTNVWNEGSLSYFSWKKVIVDLTLATWSSQSPLSANWERSSTSLPARNASCAMRRLLKSSSLGS